MLDLDLLDGTVRGTYYASLIIVILFLMLMMSIRLFVSRRKRAYLSLTLTLALCILQQILTMMSIQESLPADEGILTYGAMLLRAVTFILLNVSIYQLYNRYRVRQRLLVWFAVILAFAASMTHPLFSGTDGTEAQVRLLQHIGIELYMFLILILCFQWITPWVGQYAIYQFSLLVYFVYQLLHLTELYLLEDRYPILGAITDSLPVIYYIILFLILFERVLELMQASYAKSITDMLTGLYNRRYFMGRLEQYLNHGAPVSVIFSDIDNFKKLNDTEGHERGDEALRQVSAVLREEAEECGIAGRIGGEELVILVTDPDIHVGELAERIRGRIETECKVTASIGYSKGRKGMSAEALMKQADEAMYQAKTTGKNKVCRYTRQKSLSL